MNRRLYFFMLILLLFVGIDIYYYQSLQPLLASLSTRTQLIIRISYLTLSILSTLGMIGSIGGLWSGISTKTIRYRLIPGLFMRYTAKLMGLIFFAIDDISRLLKWTSYQVAGWFQSIPPESISTAPSLTLTQIGVIATTAPLTILGYGIAVGAHDYRIRRIKMVIPHLPAAFHGIRMAQLSDIHSGSFFNKKAVAGGIHLLLQEKPDIIFFTGDLVNDTADEVKEYFPIFSQLQAPLGIYSVLGNHDYGDYITWPSLKAKQANLNDLCTAHQLLGWRLLRNENAFITMGSDQLAILGVENWGLHFVQHGKLAKAYEGTQEAPVKLLLSHDPSHWDAQILPQFSDIDITLSGHTHGFQFGIEIGAFKWSPAQYRYKQWAGLYQQGAQYLYVNRGFGYIGYPGRIGILPEITIIELAKR
eukprot:gene2989-3732_t